MKKNLCRTGHFSHCEGGDCIKAQKECTYFKKASSADRCMSLKEAFDNHCDNLRAQTNAPIELELTLDDFILEEDSEELKEFEKFCRETESQNLSALTAAFFKNAKP